MKPAYTKFDPRAFMRACEVMEDAIAGAGVLLTSVGHPAGRHVVRRLRASSVVTKELTPRQVALLRRRRGAGLRIKRRVP